MKSPLMVVTEISKTYIKDKRAIHAVEKVSFTLHAGEKIAIIGKSGSGKSTLLNMLGGLEEMTSGSILIEGDSIAMMSEAKLSEYRNRKLGFVFQFHYLMLEFSAVENVMMPLLISGLSYEESRKRAMEVMKLVGLEDRIEHEPRQLSGGEQQRVAIARAIVTRPKILLTDEMTGNLDRVTGEGVQELIARLQREFNMGLISVTHDERIAGTYDRVLRLEYGKAL